jgi:hypothetical protein
VICLLTFSIGIARRIWLRHRTRVIVKSSEEKPSSTSSPRGMQSDKRPPDRDHRASIGFTTAVTECSSRILMFKKLPNNADRRRETAEWTDAGRTLCAVGLGLSLSLGDMRVINIAHGDLIVVEPTSRALRWDCWASEPFRLCPS